MSAMDFWKENGLKALLLKSKHKLQGMDNDYDYGEWYSPDQSLQMRSWSAQRQERFDYDAEAFHCHTGLQDAGTVSEGDAGFHSGTDLHKTGRSALRTEVPRGESVERVLRQVCGKGSGRFQYVILGENKGIAGNTNAAIDMAHGDFMRSGGPRRYAAAACFV